MGTSLCSSKVLSAGILVVISEEAGESDYHVWNTPPVSFLTSSFRPKYRQLQQTPSLLRISTPWSDHSQRPVCVLTLSRPSDSCDPMDCSPPGSSVHGISQARALEGFAISISKGSSQPRGRTRISCVCCTGRRILYHCTTWETAKDSHQQFLLSFCACAWPPIQRWGLFLLVLYLG